MAKGLELAKANVLPSSLAREIKGRVFSAKLACFMVPIFCANCGADGGHVPEPSIAEGTGFAFYLCVPCAATWAPSADTAAIPDEVFWEHVKQTMLEREGRTLTEPEIVRALDDPSHYLSKLAKDRPKRT